MARGPGKTPTSLLNKRGSWHGKNRDHEPAPIVREGEIPDYVQEDLLPYWESLVKDLRELGVYSATDTRIIARHCVLTGFCDELIAVIQAKGHTFVSLGKDGVTGFVRARPEVAMLHKAMDALLRLETQLGLTPSSRLAVSKTPVPPHGNARQSKDRFTRKI